MRRAWLKILLTLIGAYILYFISYNSTVKYTFSDPQLTLLTSQSLLQNQSTNLYPYYTKVKPEDFADGNWKYSYWEKQKKVYYFYPIGTSILSIPVVALANSLGVDFIDKKSDAIWQCIISSACVCIIFLLLTLIASKFISYYYSLLASFIFCLSTSIISTVALALWSFNYEMIFILLCFLHIVNHKDDLKNIKGYKIGMYIFVAWLCRPSVLIVIGILAVCLFFINKKQLLYFILTLFIMYIPLGIYSFTHFNLSVPAYYHPLFWTHMPPSEQPFGERLVAILFSPARGLLLFTPVLILSFAGIIKKDIRKNPLYIISFIWVFIHAIMLARQANWWGGWSYGPRLFTDALIPLFIMLIISFKNSNRKIIFASTFILLSIPGVAIHSFVGANNKFTIKWNDNPPIDEHIDYYMWNFEYAQFLADSVSNENKKEEYQLLKKLDKGIHKLKQGDKVLFNINHIACAVGEKVNAQKDFKKIKLYCDVNELLQSKTDTFYITPNLLDVFMKDSNYVMQPPNMQTLANYIQANANYHIFMATKNDLFTKMSDGTKTFFRNQNSQLFNVKEGDGFVMHLYKGKIIQESIPEKEKNYFDYEINGKNVKVISNGKTVASIKVNGKEYSINDGGFNIVCIDNKGEVTDVARFNTHFIDAEYIYLFKFYRKK